MSRRAAEKEILLGNFEINGIKAKIGDRVLPRDTVKYKGEIIKPIRKKVYICLNKPVGYITTMSDELGRKSIRELVADLGQRVYPCGRLDKDSEGIVICTNDGEFANTLMHPGGSVKKVYIVVVKGKVENNTLDALRAMRTLEGEMIMPVGVELIERNQNASKLKMTLSEGKNRQIRRMCEQNLLTVTDLRRIAIGGVFLKDLKSGNWRHLTEREKQTLVKD